jgi:hypothetical protein
LGIPETEEEELGEISNEKTKVEEAKPAGGMKRSNAFAGLMGKKESTKGLGGGLMGGIMSKLGGVMKTKAKKLEEDMITYGRKTTINSEKNHQLEKGYAE